jgi:hypothetical protein
MGDTGTVVLNQRSFSPLFIPQNTSNNLTRRNSDIAPHGLLFSEAIECSDWLKILLWKTVIGMV